MAMPYLPSCLISAVVVLPLQLLPSAFCQLVSISSGSGTQARATPKASFTSTRVTVSNVRQPSWANACHGRDWATAAAVADLRKLLRFMGSLLERDDNGGARPVGWRTPHRRDYP